MHSPLAFDIKVGSANKYEKFYLCLAGAKPKPEAATPGRKTVAPWALYTYLWHLFANNFQ